MHCWTTNRIFDFTSQIHNKTKDDTVWEKPCKYDTKTKENKYLFSLFPFSVHTAYYGFNIFIET